jgi:hypothetical protein
MARTWQHMLSLSWQRLLHSQRQVHRHCRSTAQLARQLDPPAVLLDDPARDRQPEAGAERPSTATCPATDTDMPGELKPKSTIGALDKRTSRCGLPDVGHDRKPRTDASSL